MRPGSKQTFGGRFQAVRLMKDGQGVATYEGLDLHEDVRVVIKTTDAASVAPAARLRLEHEAAVLREACGSYLTPLVGYGRDDDDLYLVVPFLDGETLASRLERGPLSVPETLIVAACLLEALEHAHALGIVHRDLKPANIMLVADHVRAATLIDFGLSRSGRLDASVRDDVAGTLRYMSPEQAGLLNATVDERSDLYSVGAVLYECLAGVPVFDGSDAGTLLRQHLSVRPQELRSRGVDVPAVIDQIIGRLLKKDPRDRYQTAASVRADVLQIAGALRRGIREPAVVVGASDVRPTLTEPAFIGRLNEIDEGVRQLDLATAGRGGLVLLEAESGGGKTRLLEELAQRASARGMTVLRGQGVDEAAQRPFQVLVGVVDGLRAVAGADAELRGSVRAGIGDRREAVCSAFPELDEVLDAAGRMQLGPEAFGEARTVEALATMLCATGTSDRPAAIFLDDCQWSDGLTIRLLREWRRRSEEGCGHVGVFVAFRSEEMDDRHPLRSLSGTTRIALQPFEDEDVARLVESMAGRVPQEVHHGVTRLSDGSPFMASAVLRGLVESGALTAGRDGWTIDRQALLDVQSSRQAAVFLTRRLELLPSPVLQLLTAGAVLGKEFDPEFAARLAGQGSHQSAPAIDEARRRHIIWIAPSGERCSFVHDKLRETLLARLTADDRRALHLRAALRIERVDRDRVFDLAYHFDAAGERRQALAYALDAAARARTKNALELAEHQYRIAERGAVGADRRTREEVAAGLGDVVMLLGRYGEAAELLERALTLADDEFGRARIEAKLCELAFKRGDHDRSAATCESALRRLGKRVPRSQVAFLLLTLREVVVQVLHTVLPRAFVGRRSLEGAEQDLLAVRLYSRLTHVYWFCRGSVPTLWAHLRELNLVERYPVTAELAQAYSEHAVAMTLLPYERRAYDYARRSFDIRTEFKDVWGQGQSLSFRGIVLYCASRYEEAIATCREAVRVLERTGDRWELNIARMHIAFSLYRLGETEAAAEEAKIVHRDGLEIGDPQASGIGMEIWSKVTGGDVPEELVRAELERPTRDVQLRAEIMQAEGVRLIGAGATRDAVAILEEARRMVRRAGLRQEYVTGVWPWLATALRIQFEELPSYSRTRTSMLRHARRVAAVARVLSASYKNNLPHALRESATLAAMAGKPRRARRWLDRAVRLAESQRMRDELMRTLRVRGRIGEEWGWPGAADDLTKAGLLGTSRPPQGAGTCPEDGVTLSLVDRFEALLARGRVIASALNPDLVYEAIDAAARDLMRSEHTLVLRIDEDGAFDPVAGDIHAPFSVTLVKRCAAVQRPVVVNEGADDPDESVVFSGARSVLAAPILVRGRAVAALYLAHSGVRGLFGEYEERIAGFIAAIAGAALENAEGFAEVAALTRSLEARVEERTMELASANEELDKSFRKLRVAYEREKEVVSKLRELDELKSDFLSTVSHELRTPLTSIKGFAETLRDYWTRIEDPKRQDFVSRIAEQSDGLAELISTLLDFARSERGHFTIEPGVRDLRERIDAVVYKLRRALAAHHVAVEVPAGLTVAVDDAAMNRILENLLTNAAKFSSPGSTIQVTVADHVDGLAVSVTDQGPGIAEDQLGRIFERFYRVDRGDTSRARGTGIGLAIVKQFVEAQGGRVWADGAVGAGSRFTFTVPRHVASDLEVSTGVRRTSKTRRAG